MKIVCQSCGAKYSIADEKVAGKVFKIRCKKCSATIVVKGDQQDADAATRVYDYGGDAIWHAVVAGEQQGPFNPRQVGELLAEGKIDWEAYVWREGMENWLPAKDVEDLVSAVMSEGGEATEAQGEPSGAAPAPVFGGSSDMGADPFASDDGGLSSVMGAAGNGGGAGAGAVAVAAGADLFGQSARSPFAGAAVEDEPSHASAGPRAGEVGPDSLTGQRNENSVLFSLSNLQALATGSGSGAAAPNARSGMAVGEGSGLIDIRALASATQSVADKPNGAAREKVEDLLAVGSASTAFSAASFAAPVAVEKGDSSKLMLGAMAAAILLLGSAVAYLAMRDPAPQPIAAVGPEPAAPSAATGVQPSAPPATSQAAALPTPERKPEPMPDLAAEDKPAKPSEHERADTSGSRTDRRKPGAPAVASGGTKPAEKPAANTAAEPAAAPVKKPASGVDSSIDDLLSGALGGKAKPAAKPAAAGGGESLAATPGRDEVISAMKSVAPKVTSCAAGATGVVQAKVLVTGATGRVTSVDVSGAAQGAAATCISKEVAKAKFAKFSQASFSFTYPFKL